MSYNINDLFVARNSRSGYEIEQSLRFNDDDSAYFQLNGGTSPTDGKIFTHSVWVKRSEISGNDNNVFGCSPASSLYNDIKFDSNDQLYYRQIHSSGGASQWTLKTSARYRDPSAWIHIVVAVDTTQATSSDRVKMYVNGAQITQFASASYPGQNQVPLGANGNYAVGIGRLTTTFTHYFDGYMAEYHYVDGTAHEPTAFGEYDAHGVWRPIKVTGITYGNRGWYLPFDPTATNGIGHDHSGNGNNFTANNFTTSGGFTDVMSDTPTTNWCTLLPTSNISSSTTFSNGNLDAQLPTASDTGWAVGSIAVSSGKYYWEVTYKTSNGNYLYVGVGEQGQNGIYPAYVIRGSDGETIDGSSSGSGTSVRFTSGDVIQVALDMDNGKWFIGKNGSYMDAGNGTGNPTAGTGYVHQNLSGTYAPKFYNATGVAGVQSFSFNAGQREFAYPPGTSSATGYFNTVLYTGTGASGNSVTGVGFEPDFIWFKARSFGASHSLWDVVTDGYLASDSTETESSATDLTIGTDGFTHDAASQRRNSSGETYVAWCWKAGGTASSNPAGSINSTVSANPSAGFSIVSYTGNGTSNQTVGHSLGVAPAMIILKDRDSNTTSNRWWVWQKSLTSGHNIYLDDTSGSFAVSGTTSGGIGGSPTSTTFTLQNGASNNNNVNENGDRFVAYCFAEVESYSKFGSYTGNGNADGPQIYTGFKPALVMIKRTDSTGNWFMFDTARGHDVELYPDSSSAEATYDTILLTNTGFKLRSTTSDRNANGGTFIYMAFAENFSADTDFKELNTANLPAPNIVDGSEYFNTVLWTGNGGVQSVSGVGFQPDMTWVKSRSISAEHWINDAVRGAGYSLPPSNTYSEQNYQIYFTSFDSDGFSLDGGTTSFNQTSATYVAWNWLAGGSGSSNTSGSITSTVSANPTAGFSIATYTGNGTSGATIGHGLGVTPAFAIFKARNASRDWLVYHQSLGATKAIYLSLTLQAETDTGFFNNTAPTSTVMTLGNNSAINVGSQTQVAYFFAEVESYSKMGSYIGNGSTDGSFVYLGFKPSWLLVKRYNTTGSWFLMDAARNTYNVVDDFLYPDSASSENSGSYGEAIDFLSNGFKCRTTSGFLNGSGDSYIFAAFAEHPFGGDGVSPAPAR